MTAPERQPVLRRLLAGAGRRGLRLAARLPAPVRRRLGALPGARRLRDRLAGRPHGPAPAPGALRPVVYLPTWLQWDVMRQRPQYLLAAMADAGHDVYFVDPRSDAHTTDEGVRVVPDLESVPGRHVILYTHFAPLRGQFDLFEDPVIIYDILDDLSIYDPDEAHLPPERRVRAHHALLMERADAVIVSSPALAERHQHERSDLVLVENGVDPGRFATERTRPAALPAGEAPIVGYHGAVAPWFDFELLAGVAELRPEWQFVIVGPVYPDCRTDVALLTHIENLHLIDEQPPDRIPDFVRAFDVGAIWFRIDDLTEAVTPLKMYEYLAAGKPCVSTPLPAAEAIGVVRTAHTVEGFVAALDAALVEAATPHFADLAAAAAAAASWERRLEPLLRELDAEGYRRVP